MPTLDRHTSRRTANGSVLPDAIFAHIDGANVYLTNEVFLYRLVRFGTSEEGELVELEDCYGLDVVRVPVADLNARQLRVVTPSPVHC